MSNQIKEFKEELKFLSGCCLTHPADYTPDDVEHVEAWVQSENDGPSGYALFRYKGGKWATLNESQDYTGHG